SSRRMRTLVAQIARRGLAANQIACALISMMARSTTRSNQRPDTLTQDRIQDRRKPLAPHGRTIHCAISGCEQSQQNSVPLFDHLIGASEQRRRHVETERLGRSQIDDEIESGRLLDRDVPGLCPAQNLVDMIGGALRDFNPVYVSSGS